jgi:hypothetical protein
MGFCSILRQWVATLHRCATAFFRLHSLFPDQEVEFSIRQGDPASSLFFTIYIVPLLAFQASSQVASMRPLSVTWTR